MSPFFSVRFVKRLPLLFLWLWGVSLAAQPPSPSAAAGKLRLASARGVPDSYIVVLAQDRTDHRGRPLLTARAVAERGNLITELAVTHRAKVGRVWLRALPGFLARLSPEDARAMADDPRVLFVEQVTRGEISPAYSECTAAAHEAALSAVVVGSNQVIDCDNPVPGQNTCRDNWGLDRIDQTFTGTGNPPALSETYLLPAAGVAVHAYILDTGITLDHQEFLNGQGASRISTGANVTVDAVNPGSTDVSDAVGNSHGTHVSAIVGGSTYGVAKNVYFHPVRITTGSGFAIDRIIDAVDWILENHPDGQPGVANLSGNGSDFPSSVALGLAIRRLIQGGISFVESAGNQNGLAENYAMTGSLFPPQVLVVGASSRLDKRWARPPGDPLCVNPATSNNCASNYGAGIDLFAPGENILSASNKPEDRACFLTGTSMAAPHATGAAALLLARFPNAAPGTVEEALKAKASQGVLDGSTLGSGSPNRLLYTAFPTSGAPVAGDLLFETPAGAPLHLSTAELAAGGIDWAGGALVYVAGSQPAHGTVSVSGQTLTYTPTGGYTGQDSFTYGVQTTLGLTDFGVVSVQVGNLTLPPVAADDAFTTAAGTALAISSATLLANDSGPGLDFYRFITLPAHGVLVEVSNGNWTYTPDPGFVGLDRFRYLVQGTSSLSDDATVDVRVGNLFDDDLIRDHFTNSSPLRDPGDPLNGAPVQHGGLSWTAASAAGFGSGVLTNIATSGGVVGGVAFQPNRMSLAGRLEAKVNSLAPGWTGIGFSSSATGGYWSDGQVWAYLRNNGRLHVAANGTTYPLYDSVTAAPGFSAGWNTLTVEYTWNEKTVRVWLNGVPQPLAISDLDDVGFAPNVDYVGFHAFPGQTPYSATQLVGIDDFHLTLFKKTTHPDGPTGVDSTYDVHSDKVRVTWNEVPLATHYRIYRGTSVHSSLAVLLPQQLTGTNFDDRTAEPGTDYRYWVQAVNGSLRGPYSSATLGRRKDDGQTEMTFQSVADATARQNDPTNNFYTDHLLNVRHTATSDGRFTFIRFELSGITGTIESAALEIHPDSGTQIPGVSVFGVDNMYWEESLLTWNNWGICANATLLWKSGELVIPQGADRMELDVTGAVRGNGTVTIGLATDYDLPNLAFVSQDNPSVPFRPALRVWVKGGPTTFLLQPTEDARVSQAAPTSNFGSEDFLRMRSGATTTERSYLKFLVPSGSSAVQSATLRLRSQETAIPRIDAERIGTHSWTENGINWNNAPGNVTAALGQALNVPANTWVDLPLFTGTGGINANGTGLHTVRLFTNSTSDNLDVWSRTSTCRPRLEVVVSP